MKVARNRNYWLAWCGCVCTTVLAMMGESGIENAKWYLLSDANVAIWLFVAWLFDDGDR